MCFFYSLPKKAKEIKKRFDKQLKLFDDTVFEDKVLIKGFDHVNSNFIVTEDSIQLAKWGLIPFWSKPEHAEMIFKQSGNVNAKEETVFTLPSFRVPIDKRRCLVPASGWFEYHYENGKAKDVYFIFLKDVDMYAFAGIYDFWKNPESGETIMTYAIVTSPANKLMTFIHNGGKNPHRMPVILRKEDEEKWLNPKTTHEVLQELMQPFPDELMDAYIIDYPTKQFRGANLFAHDLLNKK